MVGQRVLAMSPRGRGEGEDEPPERLESPGVRKCWYRPFIELALRARVMSLKWWVRSAGSPFLAGVMVLGIVVIVILASARRGAREGEELGGHDECEGRPCELADKKVERS